MHDEPIKMKSSLLDGREFYLHTTRTDPIDGRPCFNHAEIEQMKKLPQGKSRDFIERVFDTKAIFGCTVNDIVVRKIKPCGDNGEIIATNTQPVNSPTETPVGDPVSPRRRYAKGLTENDQLALENIRRTLQNATIRTNRRRGN